MKKTIFFVLGELICFSLFGSSSPKNIQPNNNEFELIHSIINETDYKILLFHDLSPIRRVIEPRSSEAVYMDGHKYTFGQPHNTVLLKLQLSLTGNIDTNDHSINNNSLLCSAYAAANINNNGVPVYTSPVITFLSSRIKGVRCKTPIAVDYDINGQLLFVKIIITQEEEPCIIPCKKCIVM